MGSADAIVTDPKGLYTAITPDLFIEGMPEAPSKCKGPKIYVCKFVISGQGRRVRQLQDLRVND
jgi:2-phospho-L-lactate transferase/gluconeogenesis factor (CofD/UPF0052 family)